MKYIQYSCGFWPLTRHKSARKSAHVPYENKFLICAAGYKASYLRSEDTEYLYGHIRMLELALPTVTDIEMTIQYELSIADSQIVVGEYEEAREHTLSACSCCEAYYEEDSPELVEPLSLIWQFLYFCDDPDYMDYFQMMNAICEANDMQDIAERNQEILASYMDEEDI